MTSGILIVNYEHISQIVVVFTLLSLASFSITIISPITVILK